MSFQHFMKAIARIALHKIGFDIHPLNTESNPTFQLLKAIAQFNVDLVLDIGANVGQFSSELRFYGYKGNILSFEPLSKAHKDLLHASEKDPLWDVYPRCALGNYNDETEINISGNSESSSLLPMLDSHLSAAPHTAYVGRESVRLVTLDSVVSGYISKFKHPFLKIDAQGFEWQVLDGAKNVLPYMCGVLIELSLIPLYKGDHLWKEMINRLESEGFTLWSLQQVFVESLNGRTLQIDGIFFRL